MCHQPDSDFDRAFDMVVGRLASTPGERNRAAGLVVLEVRGSLRRLGCRPQDMPELEGRVMLELVKKAETNALQDRPFETPNERKGYVYVVAKQVLWDYRKKSARYLEMLGKFGTEVGSSSAESGAKEYELCQEIERVLLRMKDGLLLFEHIECERTVDELVAIHNEPRSTIGVRLKRAKATARKLLRRFSRE